MFVIMLSGKAQSGKDTFAKILLERIGPAGKRFGFADKLKELAKEFGWNGSKEGEGRSFLIDLGQILRGDYELREDGVYSKYTGEKTIRETYSLKELYENATARHTPNPNFWVNLVVEDIRACKGLQVAIITDWRFKNECRVMQAAFSEGCTVRIENDRCMSINDQSEKDLDDFKFDYLIENHSNMMKYESEVNRWAMLHLPRLV